MPPEKHALLSASSASRWLVCTAAPRFEEGLPESTSEYAEEGRLAHAIGELKVTKKCTPMSTRTYNTRLNKLKKDPLYTPEMDKTTDLYLEHITEQVMAYDTAPTVAVEVQVDFSDYVPEGFGTCDCCIIGGDLLSIVDYKHGKGVPVSAVGNPQMRLYALGALHRYAPVFGDTIKRVRMTIDQPRLDSYTTDEITVEELRAWGESIKPIAQKAFSGLGEFVPGDHCRFCRGKAQCRARANINTALEDFKDCVPAGAWNEKAEAFVSAGGVVNGAPPPLLTDAEIGDLLERGAHLVQWYKDLEAYATEALLAGKEIPGWKLVAGRSIRTFTDQDAAIQAVIAAGYRVRSYDTYNATSTYVTSETRTVDNNNAPTITSSTTSGTDLGTKEEGFDLIYTVDDADDDPVTVKEYLDDVLQRSYTATLEQSNTVQCVTAANWQKVLNGQHTIKVVANDGKTDSAPYTVTFTKAVYEASITLAEPMDADDDITVMVLNVLGSIPADADLEVLVTNNANDTSPVWEDATQDVKNGNNHVFTNQTATNGFAFNFKVNVSRGSSNTSGYITSIGGAFQ